MPIKNNINMVTAISKLNEINDILANRMERKLQGAVN